MFDKYVIEKDDTPEIIAKKFNTDISFLRDINDMGYENQFIFGKEIIVPMITPSYYIYRKNDKGDTLYNIALKYNINPELFASLNGLEIHDYIYKNQELLIPKSGYSFYITKEGDTLDIISDMFGTKKEILIKDNPTIYVLEGQLLAYKSK